MDIGLGVVYYLGGNFMITNKKGDKVENTAWGKLHTVFREVGIKHEVGQFEDKSYFIILREGEGYNDFWCEFDFNKDGKFESHSICEG